MKNLLQMFWQYSQLILGPELVINGNFSAWTADNPNGWGITEVGDATSNVTEDINGCKMISDGTSVSINQLIAIIGKEYAYCIDVHSITNNDSWVLRVGDGPGNTDIILTTTGKLCNTVINTGSSNALYLIRKAGGTFPSTSIVRSISFREVL